jgi:membrane-associated phospholipid phosphatase
LKTGRRHRWQLVLGLACAVLFLLLALQVVMHGGLVGLDQAVSDWFAVHRQASLTRSMLLVSHLHQTTLLLSATALVMLVLGTRGDMGSVRALLTVPAAMLVNVGLKNLFERPRPAHEHPLVQLTTYSFPSGHAVASTVFYGILCALVFAHTRSRAWRCMAIVIAATMVLVVGFSRVYLGAHFPSDVLAGTMVGLLWVLLSLRLLSPASPPGPGLPVR